MPHDPRNSVEEDGWLLKKLNDFELLKKFDCGDCDLNEYFKEDAVAHREMLLTETYHISIPFEELPEELPFPIGLVSLCNDAVRKEKVNLKTSTKNCRKKNDIQRIQLSRYQDLVFIKIFKGTISEHI